jgi:hypothetical protein
MGMARLDDNEFRLNIDESARIAGLHFKVDSVLNNHREVVGLFAGDLVAEHRAACELARKLYYTEPATDADVVVANSYPDEMQVGRSYWTFGASLRPGGDAVLLCHSWEGQNMLFVASRFGTSYGAQFWDPQTRDRAFARADRVFLLAPFLSRVDREELAPPEKLVWCKTWDELVGQLAARHGVKAKVAVYPYAPLQMSVL